MSGKSSRICAYLIILMFLQIMAKMSVDGSTRRGDRMSGGVSSSLQSEQFQLKIRHAKFQCKLRKPKKFRQMFLDGVPRWIGLQGQT